MRKHLWEISLFAGSVIFLSLIALHYGTALNPDTWSYAVYAQELREGRLPVYSHDGSLLSEEFFYFMIVPKPFQILLSFISPVPWLLTLVSIIIGSAVVLFSSKIAGLLHPKAAYLAPFLILFNNEFILATITAGSIIVFIGLAFPIIYYLLAWREERKTMILISLLLLAAGLTRPEAWLLLVPIALFVLTHHQEKIKIHLRLFALLPLAVLLAVLWWIASDAILAHNPFWSFSLSTYAQQITGAGISLGFFKFIPAALVHIYISTGLSALLLLLALVSLFSWIAADIKNLTSPLLTFPATVIAAYWATSTLGGLFVPRFIFIASLILLIFAGAGAFILVDRLAAGRAAQRLFLLITLILLLPAYAVPLLPDDLQQRLSWGEPMAATLQREAAIQEDMESVAAFLQEHPGRALVSERRIPQLNYLSGLDYTRFYSFRRMAYLDLTLEDLDIQYIVYTKGDILGHVEDTFAYLDQESPMVGNKVLAAAYQLPTTIIFALPPSP